MRRFLRPRRRRPIAAPVIVVLVAVSACDQGSQKAEEAARPPDTNAIETTEPRGAKAVLPRCIRSVPFHARWLPAQLQPEFRPVSAKESSRESILLGRYRGRGADRGRVLDLFAGNGRHAITRGRPVGVLSDRGRMGTIHEGFAATFTFRDCRYTMEAYGLSRPELRGVVGHLAPGRAPGRDMPTVVIFERRGVCDSEPPIRYREVSVPVPNDQPLRTALAEWFDSMRRHGARPRFRNEPRVPLREVTVEEGIATVDLYPLNKTSFDYAGTSCGGTDFWNELHKIVFQFPHIEGVRFRFNGSCNRFFSFFQMGDCRATHYRVLERDEVQTR